MSTSEPAVARAAGRPVAIIDIGSNSVRLVAYEALSRAPAPLYNEKVLCGLGRNVLTSGRLADEAAARAVEALGRFRLLCDTIGAGEVLAVATAAARDAANGPEFLRAAEAACGRPIELLSGRREAELSALGVLSGFHAPDGVVGDLGGGSLEMIEIGAGEKGAGEKGIREIGTGVTMPLGGLALQDLSGGSTRKAAKIAREALARAKPQLARLRGRSFYAVGGTWRALAKLHQAARGYPLSVMHGYAVDATDELDFLGVVEGADAATLKNVESVSEARRPLLAYGAVVLEEIIRTGRPKDVVVSSSGVREGLLYERLPPEMRAEDPLLSAAALLNRLRARSPGHGEELVAWTDRFVAGLGLPESAGERRLRHAACLLSDVGWRAHPDYRGEQSLNLIAHGGFVGIDHPGRAYLALAIYFRHDGLAPDKASPTLRALAGTRLFEQARLLAAMLRVAFPISVATAGVLPRTPLTARGARAVLHLPRPLGALAGERLLGRLRQLGRITGLEGRVEIG